MVVAVVNVDCAFKHRVHEIFCGHVYELGEDMKGLIKKFELSNFWKGNKFPTTNHKQIFWYCFSNLMFVNCIFLGYSSLNISSTIIRDFKLKLMSKYK